MIEIAPYDPRWPEEFASIAQKMRAALSGLALRVDHIGSTAVPGLAAKDKIDIQITLRDLEHATEVVEALTPLGYLPWNGQLLYYDHRPPLADGPDSDWAKMIFVADDTMRPTNLHARMQGRPNQIYPLLFRDYLRAHPAAAAAYGVVKVHLARLHPDDPDFYYAIKNPVCDVIMGAAQEWATFIGWQMEPSAGFPQPPS